MLYYIDIGYRPNPNATITLIDVEQGESKHMKQVTTSTLVDLTHKIVDYVLATKPSQLIFDRQGYGATVADTVFEILMREYGLKISKPGIIMWPKQNPESELAQMDFAYFNISKFSKSQF